MMPDHFSTLRRVILACMILVPLIPFMLALGIGYYYFKTSLENSTIASMKRIVHDHRQMIESFLKERKHDLNFIPAQYFFIFSLRRRDDRSHTEWYDPVRLLEK
jgi:two-component system NtrC family sensor kinase